MPTSFRARLAAIAIGALALRVLYVLVLARHVPVAGDSHFFHYEANVLAQGHGFIEPFVWRTYGFAVPTAAHPPLYPLTLAGLSWLGADTMTAHRLLGCGFGAVTVVLIALIARRVGGERVGLAAAAIAALYPVLVAADGAPLSESLYGTLIAATLLTALALRTRPRLATAALLGVLIGLATLTRSEALLLLLLLPLALVASRERRLARTAIVLAGCVVVLLPWSIRNISTFHEPTLFSHNYSAVLAGANCGPTYGGADMGAWRFDCISQRVTFKEGEQAAIWRRAGLRYAGDHPLRLALVVVPVRVLRTWGFWQPTDFHYAEGRAHWADEAGVYVYFVLLALAVVGTVLLARRGSRPALLVLLAPALLVTIASAIGWGLPRFRHAFEPSLVVLAAYALVALVERRAGRSTLAASASAR